MPAARRFALDDAAIRPGTYYNPQTDMLLVVDDSAALDHELFDAVADPDDEAVWVLVADDVPVDESTRDELVEHFEARHHPGASGAVTADEDDFEDEIDELEPDEDEDDLGVEELEGF